MSLRGLIHRGSALALMAVLWLMPQPAWGQYYPPPGYPGGGYGGGYPGMGGFGPTTPQQLPPPILRNNWYMYNSVGGMGTTGGTVQVVTQFGQNTQQQNQGGGGGGGYGGGYYDPYQDPGYYGVNYRRRQAAAMYAAAYYNAVANYYRANTLTAANSPYPTSPPSSGTSRAITYIGFGLSSSPSFTKFDTGFSGSELSSSPGFGGFEPKTDKDSSGPGQQ